MLGDAGPTRGAGPETAPVDAWMKVIADQARPGDWLLVHGPEVGDPALAADTLGAAAEVAVLDKARGEALEPAGDGVRATPLPALLAAATRLQIVRPPGWIPESGDAAVAKIRARVRGAAGGGGGVGPSGSGTPEADHPGTTDADARFPATELAVGAYDGRRRGWKLPPVAPPADLAGLGTVIFDSGARDTASLLESRFARRLGDARGVPYAAEVAPGIYRGGQPDADGIAWLKSKGVKTIVNLRHFHGDTEKRQVEAAGLTYHRIALASSDPPAPTQVARFLALIRDPTLRPIYFHCKHGVDRTGAMMAVYRIEDQGWTNADAFAEMQYFFAHRMWRDLRNFVRKYQRGSGKPD